MNPRNFEELEQIVVKLRPEWRISTSFDPREDYGRGRWVSTVMQPSGVTGVEFVVARAKNKRQLTAAVLAVEAAMRQGRSGDVISQPPSF